MLARSEKLERADAARQRLASGEIGVGEYRQTIRQLGLSRDDTEDYLGGHCELRGGAAVPAKRTHDADQARYEASVAWLAAYRKGMAGHSPSK